MTRVVLSFFILLSLAATAQAAPQMTIVDNQVVAMVNGQSVSLPGEIMPLQKVVNSTLRYARIGEDDAPKYGLAVGWYLFDEQGKLAAFIQNEAAEFSFEVNLSPGATILAMDSGTFLIRSYFFYSYPDLKPMGEITYYQHDDLPTLFWAGEEGVVYTSIATESERQCGYDPCGPTSVNYFEFKTGKDNALLAGTAQCDYMATALNGRDVTAVKMCLESAAAWNDGYPEGRPSETVTVKLP